jgi:hypothetical protein
MFTGRYVSPPIRLNLPGSQRDFQRADVEITGVDQSGPSFEVRVFLNNPNAGIDAPATREHGYGGSFHVYGYGVWPADIGKAPEERAAASKTIRAPIQKTVIATEAIRAAAAQSPEITVTLVPVFPGNPPRDAGDALKFEDLRIVLH